MKMSVKKLAVSAMLVALAVSLSSFAIPIGASKCFPIQHLANVVAGVFLGPRYYTTVSCFWYMRKEPCIVTEIPTIFQEKSKENLDVLC